MLQKGARVRVISDPGRIGVLTGKCRQQAGTLKYLVSFPDGNGYLPDYEMEEVTEDADVFSLLDQGRFGRRVDLRRNLTHRQLSGRLSNLVYSMDITNTEFYAYQFKPVLSLLESPSKGLLIADEVGLGKTIEAGLIWTELRARYDARRLLVVCPAMLREKWCDELQGRFGIDVDIRDAEGLLSELGKSRNQIREGKGIVCSLQGLRPPREDTDMTDSSRRRLSLFLEEQAGSDPVLDLLIIDEAHYLRNPNSQSARLGQMLRDVSEHVVLLSATPINLKSDDLYHLLHLVDPDTFDDKEVFPQILAANEPLQKARDLALDKSADRSRIRKHLQDAGRHFLFTNNRQLRNLVEEEIPRKAPNADLETEERVRLANRIERINLLKNSVSRTRKREVTEWKVIRNPNTEFIVLTQQERDFYDEVTRSIRQYADDRGISEGFLLSSPQRQVSSCMCAAVKAWKNRQGTGKEQLYEDFGIELEDENHATSLIEHLNRTVMSDVDPESLRNHDSKYRKFRDMVSKCLDRNPDEKIVVFSFFRQTLKYLSERLMENGVKSRILVGGMNQSKQDVINEFRDDASCRVLLSSEVASEGVDLQFCRILINYDLPWNPMRIEQRIGRIDRIGQTAEKIHIWNLCYADTIDQRIHERLFERLDIFRRALGGMEEILGKEIRSLTNDLFREELTEEQQNDRIEQTSMAIEKVRQDQNELEMQASHLIAHGGYILEQVQAAHDLKRRITEQDLVVYVKDYLEQYCEGHVFRQTSSSRLVFQIRLPAKTVARFDEFIHDKRLHGQTRLSSGDEISCEFINKVGLANRKTESISQFHPLVRFIGKDLTDRDEAFHPLMAIRLSCIHVPGMSRGLYAFAVGLWKFSGIQSEEELRARAVPVGSDTMLSPNSSWKLVNCARLEGGDWLSVGNETKSGPLGNAFDACMNQLAKDYEQARSEREDENHDRVNFQIESAQRYMQRQLQIHDRVLADLRAKGHVRLIPAREGLIRKVKDRFDVQMEKLRSKELLKSHPLDICCGVVRLE